MDLIYTTYRNKLATDKVPEWLEESSTLCSVSSQNILLFTTSLPLADRTDNTWGNYVYCADLNLPWDCSLVCTLSAPATCLAWDGSGTRFVVGDAVGHLAIWRMSECNLSLWTQLHSAVFEHERFIAGCFLATSRTVTRNTEMKDSRLYNQKFQFGFRNEQMYNNEGCVLVSSSGLLVGVVLEDNQPVTATAWVGRGRRRLCHADMAMASRTGEFLLATCGDDTPITVHTVTNSLDLQGELDLRVTTHSSISLPDKDGAESLRIVNLKFVLGDSTDALVVAIDEEEGGRLQMWELEQREVSCHKLLASQLALPRSKLTPYWRYADEFGGGGSRLVSLATPRCSVMGGEKPACYIILGCADGSLQCLIRDSLQHIKSVELPRSGNSPVTICHMCFSSTGTALVVTDSLGQIYLYRMSPIADPGGQHVAPYLVTMYEYCLVSGKDWWDLALAARDTNLLDICDQLEATFNAQPVGVQNFCSVRYTAIRASLFRLCPASQYRAADTLALLMLQSICGELRSLLTLDPSLVDQDPAEKLETIIRSNPGIVDLDSLINSLLSTGFQKELHNSAECTHYVQQLSHWLLTLALHVLSAVPEFKTRKGPGFWLLQEGGLQLLLQCIAIIRLWALPRPVFITREKDMDLPAKLFSILARLGENNEEETLLDECLMLPSQVIVPALDTRVSCRGVLAGLQAGLPLPLAFSYGQDPGLCPPPQPPFLEGLPYTEESGRKYFYDSMRKSVLGRQPAALKQCNRCNTFTQTNLGSSKTTFGKVWEKRWEKSCYCGGFWKLKKF